MPEASIDTTPNKLKYIIAGCTGHDDDSPPEMLTSPDSTVLHKGWVSQRFCLYPQQIVLKLAGQSRVQKIQILVHHFKIPTRIEIYSSNESKNHISRHLSTQEIESIQFTRLGYISFNDNVSNGYRVRELKTVHLDIDTTFIKLLIHKCHINALNLYNQVSIVGINILGSESKRDRHDPKFDSARKILDPMLNIDDPEWSSSEAVIRGLIEKTGLDRRIPETADLVYSLSHDRETLRIIECLELTKKESIKRERFQEAKSIKDLIHDLKQLGSMIASLTLRKYEAIESENFDNAQKFKAEITALKDNGKQKLAAIGFSYDEEWGIKRIPLVPGEPRHAHVSERNTTTPPRHSITTQNTKGSTAVIKEEREFQFQSNDIQSTHITRNEAQAIRIASHEMSQSDQELIDPQEQAKVSLLPNIHVAEERPIEKAKQVSREVPSGSDSTPAIVSSSMEAPNKASDEAQDLSLEQKDQYKLSLSIFGENILRNTLAKEFRFREAGIHQILESLDNSEIITNGHVEDVSRATIEILVFLSEDSREKTSLLVAKLWTKLFSVWAATSEKNDVWLKNASEVVPLIMHRVSDSNARVRKAYFDLILKLAVMYHKTPHSILAAFLRPPKPVGRGNTVSHKVIKAHLELLRNLVITYGLEPQHASGLRSDKISQFIKPFLDHTSHEVREEAASISEFIAKHRVSPLPFHEHEEKKIEGTAPKSYDTRPKSSKMAKQDLRLSNTKKAPSPTLPEALDRMCIFCDRCDPKFTEAALDEHYWSDCPMLMKCSHCQLFVEIPSYVMHLNTECDAKDNLKQCPSCRIPMSASDLNAHVRQDCKGPLRKGQSRCPLCHAEFSGLDAMRLHLINAPGCKGNPRKPNI